MFETVLPETVFGPFPKKGQKRNPKGPNLEKIQSRLKFSISLEIFNLDLQNSPQKIGVGGWLAWKFQSRLKISRSWKFSRFGPLGKDKSRAGSPPIWNPPRLAALDGRPWNLPEIRSRDFKSQGACESATGITSKSVDNPKNLFGLFSTFYLARQK